MKHRSHSFIVQKLTFVRGSGCDCKDHYRKIIPPNKSIVLRKEFCRNGRQLSSCPWELIFVEDKVVKEKIAGGVFVEIENQIDEWMIN